MSPTLLRSQRALGRACASAAFHGLQGPLLALMGLAFSMPVFAATTNLIQNITPASAPQGTNGLVVTLTLGATPPPPPTNVPIRGVTIGSIAGTPFAHTNQHVIAALFSIPGNAATGAQDVTINYGGGAVVSHRAGGFTITPATSLTANFTATPTNGIAPLAVSFTDLSAGMVTNWLWDFGEGGTSTDANPTHTYNAAGSFTVSLTVWGPLGSNTVSRAGCIIVSSPPTNGAYVIVDTGQANCYDHTSVILAPAAGQPFYGQDAQVQGRQPAYRDNGDGTVSDLNTGLMWVKARGAQVSWAAALSGAPACTVGGYYDWRMPTMKELYSLVQFTGQNGTSFTSPAGYIPFIDTNYFGFAYGPGTSTEVGSRIIDAQDWSADAYVSTVMNGQAAVFGFNFTDGRIKGYPPGNSNYVRHVRGNPVYGINKFVNNGDGTITDKATWLMWTRNDSGAGMNWLNALAWVQQMNASNYLGHNDWRLPNAKELHSLFDYTRSPDTTASAAVHPLFNCTAITNEAGQPDFPWYWTGTTLMGNPSTGSGVYLCFGRAMAYMNNTWLDAHGAGAQRSDPKGGSLSSYTYVPNGYFSPLAPQGDAIRIYNHVRLVREVPVTSSWRFAFVGDTHTPLTGIPAEIAASVVNDDAKFLLIAGDLVDSGAAASTNTLASQLAQWRAAMAPLAASGIPVYVIRGNHEDDVNNDVPVWNNFFSGAYSMPGNGPDGETNLTYSFTTNNALFVGLDNWPVNRYSYNGTNAPYTPVNVATNPSLTYAAVNRYTDSVGDGISDWWRAKYFGGSGTSTNALSCATADPDHDGVDNYHEYLTDANPTNSASYFRIQNISCGPTKLEVFFPSSASRKYTLSSSTNLTSGNWVAVPSQTDVIGTGGLDALTDARTADGQRFYRIGVHLP